MSLSRQSLNSDTTFRIPAEGVPPLRQTIAPEFSQLFGAESPFRLYADEAVLEEAAFANRRKKLHLRSWGKKTVVSDIVSKDLNELLSLRGRPPLQFKALAEVNNNSLDDSRRTAYTTYSLVYSNEALRKMYVPEGFPASWFRGWEDALQIINIPLTILTVGIELALKMFASILNQPFRKGSAIFLAEKNRTSKRILGFFIALVCLPFWAMAQPLYMAGNGVGQLRRVIDACCNLISSSVSWMADFFRAEQRYARTYPPILSCIKIFFKNALQLIPKLILLGAVFFPGGQVIPVAATLTQSGFLQSILAPVGQFISSIFQPITQGLAGVFSKIGANVVAGITTAATVSVCDQVVSGCIDKIARSSMWNFFKRRRSESGVSRKLDVTPNPFTSSNESLDTPLSKLRSPRFSSNGMITRILNQDLPEYDRTHISQVEGWPHRHSKSSHDIEVVEVKQDREDYENTLDDLLSVPPPMPFRRESKEILQPQLFPRDSLQPPPPPTEPHPDDLLQPPPPPDEPHPDELQAPPPPPDTELTIIIPENKPNQIALKSPLRFKH